ncbi:putative tyrosinase-like protein tyr-1 isoform X1 [Montipora foliosa]|uniref:putative tyrosinase-like protein tyr-1 isoform X1 n=1 Tax=Montipora foliosa TaxID=591990 RepID=UPI0035F142B1
MSVKFGMLFGMLLMVMFSIHHCDARVFSKLADFTSVNDPNSFESREDIQARSTCRNWDDTEKCERWYRYGECVKNPTYVLKRCPKSCSICSGNSCEDHRNDCAALKARGDCTSRISNTAYATIRDCPVTCGACD